MAKPHCLVVAEQSPGAHLLLVPCSAQAVTNRLLGS